MVLILWKKSVQKSVTDLSLIFGMLEDKNLFAHIGGITLKAQMGWYG